VIPHDQLTVTSYNSVGFNNCIKIIKGLKMRLLVFVLMIYFFLFGCQMDSTIKTDYSPLPKRIEGPVRLQEFYAALQHQDYAFMWNMIAPDPDNVTAPPQCDGYTMLEFPGKAVGGVFCGRDKVLDRFIGLQILVNGSLKFVYRWVGTSNDGGDKEILEFYTTADVPINGVDHPYFNRGTVIVTFNKNNKIVVIHDYLDTGELVLVGKSDNKNSLHERVRQAREKAGLPESFYPPCPDKPSSLTEH
jgi:hypothetical protein